MTKYRIIKRLNYCNELRYFIQYKSLWIWNNLNLSGFMTDPGYRTIDKAEHELSKYINNAKSEIIKLIEVSD